MIVYIAGKMAGLQDLGYFAFDRAEHKLTGLGYQVLNPAWLGKGLPKETYMPICLSMLQQADAIVMLDGWEDSPGARLEKAYAEYQSMPVCRLADKGLIPLCTFCQKQENETVDQLKVQLEAALGELKRAAEENAVCIGCKHYGVPIKDSPACTECDCECEKCKDPCPCASCERASNWEWDGGEK